MAATAEGGERAGMGTMGTAAGIRHRAKGGRVPHCWECWEMQPAMVPAADGGRLAVAGGGARGREGVNARQPPLRRRKLLPKLLARRVACSWLLERIGTPGAPGILQGRCLPERASADVACTVEWQSSRAQGRTRLFVRRRIVVCPRKLGLAARRQLWGSRQRPRRTAM